jgi:hypothetical protein
LGWRDGDARRLRRSELITEDIGMLASPEIRTWESCWERFIQVEERHGCI